jgi:membrane protein YdbS with pleckstrin-like domain
MTVTFILSMVVGVATVIEGRNPLMEGFGMVSLVALAPILSVLILGILYRRKEKENEQST